MSCTAYRRESNCRHVKQMRNVLQLCGRGSNLQHWALYKEVMVTSHVHGNSLYVQATSAWRDWNRGRSSEVPQTIPCTLDKVQATGMLSYMLSCSCVQRVCKMAGVYLCSFIGPYNVQGSKETYIQQGWLLTCLNQFYMSNSMSWLNYSWFYFAVGESKPGWQLSCVDAMASAGNGSGENTPAFLLPLLPCRVHSKLPFQQQ